MESNEDSKMTPTVALMHVMSTHYMLSDSKRRYPKPGQLVERMGPEVREALSRLTSDEAREMSIALLGGIESKKEQEAWDRAQYDPLFAQEMRQRQASIRLKLMFDEKLRRRSN